MKELPVMQGKKKVDGIYFASVVPKPKDVRLYFFPIYIDKEEFKISDNLNKCLKGKSCFYFKDLDDELTQNVKDIITKSVEVYDRKELL
ncbi:MAG: hypothetical protein IH946_08925 [Bacteroidetes bacterium]|nr:hypothetical protein [Bacteroidota bacterium]